MPFNEVDEMAFIEGNKNAKRCIVIMQDNLRNSALKLKILNLCYFLQDSDPKHTLV